MAWRREGRKSREFLEEKRSMQKEQDWVFEQRPEISRRLRAREGGLGGWSRVSRGQNEAEREQETRFRGAFMWMKQAARRGFWTEECLGKLAPILGNFGTKSECSCSWKQPLPILWQQKQSPICRERRMSQVCGEKMKSEAGREVSLPSQSCSCSC